MTTLTYDQAVETYKAHKAKWDHRLHGIKGGINAFMKAEKKRYESKNRHEEQSLLNQLETDLNN